MVLIGVCFIQEIHEGLDFAVDDDSEYSFGIFSVKFSTDGRELVAASSDDSIYVYDLQENKLALRIPAHTVVIFIFCDKTFLFSLYLLKEKITCYQEDA